MDTPAVDAPAAEPAAVEPVAAVPSTPKPSRKEKRTKFWAETKGDMKWATALLFVMILAYAGGLWGPWQAVPEGSENLSDVTDTFFSRGNYTVPNETESARMSARGVDLRDEPGLVAPFEILSVLLLAALIAGVVIAIREPEGGR